jgi:hypothetical protein
MVLSDSLEYIIEVIRASDFKGLDLNPQCLSCTFRLVCTKNLSSGVVVMKSA